MKKQFLLLFTAFGVYFASAQETITDAHASNYRTWSIGINGGNTFSLGDAMSFDGDKGEGVPNGIGTVSMGIRGHLTKFFNPTFALQGSAGYHQISGSDGDLWFAGDYIDGDISAVFNLSNWILKGRIYERKSAIFFTAGIGAALIQGGSYFTPTNDINSTVNNFIYGNDPRSIQATVPLSLQYKYKLTNSLDFDGIFKYTIIPEDFPDAVLVDNTGDMFAYVGVGLSYNFGDKDKKSIAYTNPLDDMYATIEEVKNNFDKLTTDDDGDGVNNYFDKDNTTPEGVTVDGSGKAMDVDEDGIPDSMDKDPFTAKGAKVDAEGRAVDSDGDGVADYMDQEANTPKGTMVNFKGQTIKTSGGGDAAFVPSIYFSFNSANITAANHERLATIARLMKNNPKMKMKVVGYADKIGSEEYNKNLGMRRAQAVVKQLSTTYSIDESRFSAESKGEAEPLADGQNNINRRVDVIPQ